MAGKGVLWLKGCSKGVSPNQAEKHRGYERTNENGTERIRMEEIQNLVRISCVVRLAKLVV